MELDHILAGLTEINVQLRQVLQMSKAVATTIDSDVPIVYKLNEQEFAANPQFILGDMARTEKAIDYLIQEISILNGNSLNQFKPIAKASGRR